MSTSCSRNTRTASRPSKASSTLYPRFSSIALRTSRFVLPSSATSATGGRASASGNVTRSGRLEQRSEVRHLENPLHPVSRAPQSDRAAMPLGIALEDEQHSERRGIEIRDRAQIHDNRLCCRQRGLRGRSECLLSTEVEPALRLDCECGSRRIEIRGRYVPLWSLRGVVSEQFDFPYGHALLAHRAIEFQGNVVCDARRKLPHVSVVSAR